MVAIAFWICFAVLLALTIVDAAKQRAISVDRVCVLVMFALLGVATFNLKL